MESRTTITDTGGHERLTLQHYRGYFRALVWSAEHGHDWRRRAVITQGDFQRGWDRARKVSGLHSFDPATGHAIIKVGESQVPFGEGVPGRIIRYKYSWPEWDPLTNCEIRVLRICHTRLIGMKLSINPIRRANRHPDYLVSPESFNRLEDTSKENFDRFVDWLFSHTLSELRAARGDMTATRAAWIRYFQRGLRADLVLYELMHHLPELLIRAQYPREEAQRVLEMIKLINFEDIGIKRTKEGVRFTETSS